MNNGRKQREQSDLGPYCLQYRQGKYIKQTVYEAAADILHMF